MKRLISILLIVTMMLASVLAMIPAFAEEGDYVAAYDVDWKKLVEGGTMRSQWAYDRGPGQNNMAEKYNITATDSALSLTKKGGDHRQYYSELMFPMTADTQYVYELEVKSNSPDGDGGFIFAFGANPNGKIDGDDIIDINGVMDNSAAPVAAYFLNGRLNSEKAAIKFGGGWGGYGYESGKDYSQALDGIYVSEDGYSNYKVVYSGLTIELFYLNTDGEWVELYADKTITLAETTSVAFGIYAWGTDWANIRNCVVAAGNDATELIMAEKLLDAYTAIGEKYAAKGGYTATSAAALAAAIEAAKAAAADEAATFESLAEAAGNLDAAIDDLVIAANKAELNEMVTAAEAALTEAEFGAKADEWAAYVAALAAAKAVIADADAEQDDADEALAALNAAIEALLVGLDTSALEAKVAEAKALFATAGSYVPATWAAFAAAVADAEALLSAVLATPAMLTAAIEAIDAAQAALALIPDAVASIALNWSKYYNTGAMRGQWWNVATDAENKYHNIYNITATENLLSSAPKGEGDNHTYYSTVRYAITADTYYEYTFSAKNNRAGGYAGVMFAYDLVGTNTYFIYGEFDNHSDNGTSADFRFRRGHYDYKDRDPSSHFVENDPRYYPVVTEDEEGFGQFKFVYEGYNFSFYYLDANGAYVQIGDTLTLPEGTAVCAGVFSRGGNLSSQRTVSLKDCTVKALNDVSAANLAKAEYEFAVTLANAKIASGSYTTETVAVLQAALDAMNAAIANTEATATELLTASEALYAAILALVNKTNLAKELANIAAMNLVEADWTVATWAPFAAALATANEVNASATATQADVDAALEALKNTFKALDLAAEGDKTALNAKIAEAEAALTAEIFADKPDAWAEYVAVLEAVKAVAAATDEKGNQTRVDEALVNLVAAIKKLVAADKTALKGAIDVAVELVEGKYEAEGWPEFVAALAAAQTVYNSDVALQDAIDAATTALNAAMDALVRKPLEKKAEFVMNWKYAYDNGLMKAQWWNETWQNDFENHFTVNATENMINVVAKFAPDEYDADGNPPTDASKLGDTRAYYSTNMYKITATSYYELTFKVKRDAEISTYAGVVFAYDTTSVSDNQLAYILYGGLNNKSDFGDNSYLTVQYGHHDGATNNGTGAAVDRIAGPVKELVVAVDEENFATYKIVYDGYWAHFFYTDPTTGEFVEMPLLTVKLKETAAVCLGMYTRNSSNATNQRTVTIKDATLVAMNDEAAGFMTVNKADLAAKLTEIEALNEAEYTAETWAILKEAYLAAKAMNENADALQVQVDTVLAALVSAQSKLGKPGDPTALLAKIAEAEALKMEDFNVTALTWNVFVKAIEDAKAVAANANATQGDIDVALSALADKMASLEPKAPAPSDPSAPSDPETDAPATDAPATEAPATDAPATEAPKEDKGGCGSSVALSALAIVGVIGTALVIKKKED